MIGNRAHSTLLAALLLLALLPACETGRETPAADEVTATLQRVLDDNPTLSCTEFGLLHESGAGATYRYYTVRATCAARGGTGDSRPVQKYFEMRYDCLPEGWRFKMIREVGKEFAEDPASRGPMLFTAHPEARRILYWVFGTLVGVIALVLILWVLHDRYQVLPAVARRLRLSRQKQPHQSKHFDSINPMD